MGERGEKFHLMIELFSPIYEAAFRPVFNVGRDQEKIIMMIICSDLKAALLKNISLIGVVRGSLVEITYNCLSSKEER